MDMLTDRLAIPIEHQGDLRDGFAHLNAALEKGILSRIGPEPILYIETEYFGGVGGQGAALFKDGELTWQQAYSNERSSPPLPAKTPISRGLAELGVVPTFEHDEFDSVGLARFRSLEKLGLYEWDNDED